MRAYLFIIFLSCLSGISLSQKPYIELSVSPNTVEKGDEFTLEIKTNVPGKLSIDNLPASFTLNQYSEGSSITTMDPNTGDMEIILVSTYTGTIDIPGNYTIGPAFVTSGRGSYSSNKVQLTVEKEIQMYASEITAQQLKTDAFGMIQTNKAKIYEGEPLIASSKIYTKNYSRIADPKSYTLQGALDNHPLGDPNRLTVKEENIKGIHFYTYEFDKQLIFPTGSGKLKIEPFEVTLIHQFKQSKITSSYTVVDIIPLPANPPVDFIGGVGEFEVMRSAEIDDLKQGDVFKMIVTIKGKGNLQNTNKPRINLPKGFIIYGDPVVTEDYRFNSQGCEGMITYEYNIQVTRSGKNILPPVSISFFDVNWEKYISTRSDSLTIVVKKDPNYVASDQNIDDQMKDEIELSAPAIMKTKRIVSDGSFFGSGIYWSGIGAPVLAAFMFLFFRKAKSNRETKMEEVKIVKDLKHEVDQLINKAEGNLQSGSADEFYSSLENALRRSFALKMNAGNDVVNKSDIYAYILNKNGTELLNKTKHVFDICEQSRYGMFGTGEDRSGILQEVKEIISKVK